MQITVTVGMSGISHSSLTKQHALAMLHYPQKDPDDMWDMSDEGAIFLHQVVGLNRHCCDITSECSQVRKLQLGFMVH